MKVLTSRSTIYLILILLLAACMPSQMAAPTTLPATVESKAESPAATPGAEQTTSDATNTPVPEAPPATPPASPVGERDDAKHQDFIWACSFCGGSQIWSFTNGEAQLVDLPVDVAYAYGYSTTTGQLLYSSPSEPIGGGPSQMAVNNLWLLDVTSGETQAIFSDLVVVEADLAPDGEHFAYVLATESTYELHWRNLDDEDTLLASDVAFTFSISPDGDKVAFTRESNYGLPGVPGLYVVDVATGEEVMIADADRAGTGSIDDKPVWSPSSHYVLLPTYGNLPAPGLVRAAVDGRGSKMLDFAAELADEAWYQTMLSKPFWISDTHILAEAAPGSMNQQVGGELSIFLLELNDTADMVIAGALISSGTFVGWDVPGESIWVQMGMEMQSVPLPPR